MTEKDKYIQKMMSTLGCTADERRELWAFDHEEIDNEERDNLTAKAKEIRHYEKGESTKKQTAPKERKIDPDKKYLHTLLMLALAKSEIPTEHLSAKNEAEIYFDFNGSKYTIKLTKHRK